MYNSISGRIIRVSDLNILSWSTAPFMLERGSFLMPN